LERAGSIRPAEPLAELDEIAGDHEAVAVELEDIISVAKELAEGAEITCVQAVVAVNFDLKAKKCSRQSVSARRRLRCAA
jgi:hypothetical protein